MNRYIIEFGMGMDLHGQDITKAAVKAVKDATSKSCLCGLSEVLKLEDLGKSVAMTVTVAVSKPEAVDKDVVAKACAMGDVTVKPILGGMKAPGLCVPQLGDADESIEVALACVEVFIK